MRIYNQGVYTNSYRRNNNINSFRSASSSSLNNINRGSINIQNMSKSLSSFPSVQKIDLQSSSSSLLSSSENNEENSENANPMGVVAKTTTTTTATDTSTAPPRSLSKGLSCRTLHEPIPEGGACSLVYEPDSSGRLVEHYSKTDVQNGLAVVARWTAGHGKKIAGFKFKRNLGRQVLIGNCSAGVQGRHNYCNGFCQFVKSAKLSRGDVTLYDVPTGFKAMPVDVYLYYNDNRPGHQTIKLVPGKAYTTENVLAVGVVPSGAPFYEHETVALLKWLHDAEKKGYSSKMC